MEVFLSLDACLLTASKFPCRDHRGDKKSPPWSPAGITATAGPTNHLIGPHRALTDRAYSCSATRGGPFRAIAPPDVCLAPSKNFQHTHAHTQPSDDGGSFFSDCGPFLVPSSPPFFYLPIPSFLPSIAFTSPPLRSPSLPVPSFLSFLALPPSYPSSFLSSPRPAPYSAPFLLPLLSLSPPLIFPPSPPVRSRPIKSSYKVWRSIVSSLSGVWGRSPTEVEFSAF